jgi:bactofilin
MTVVARGARVKGTLVSAESIRIDGHAKGKIAARGDVFFPSHSHVEADIQAQNVVTAGTLKGSITARTMTEVERARMEGHDPIQGPGRERGGPGLRQGEHRLPGRPRVDGSAYQEDELLMGYEESVRRAAEWYKSASMARRRSRITTPRGSRTPRA